MVQHKEKLQLNTRKTKETVLDFQRSPAPATTLFIEGEAVEVFRTYKYLGPELDNKLNRFTDQALTWYVGRDPVGCTS